MSFTKCLIDGHKAEELVANSLGEIGIEAYRLDGRDNDMVALIDGQEVGVEVKWDRMAQKTGNAALEFWNPRANHPSGLTATKAVLWLHVLGSETPNTIFLASVRSLRTYCQKTVPHKTIPRAGDGNASLWLYRLDKLVNDGIFLEFSRDNIGRCLR